MLILLSWQKAQPKNPRQEPELVKKKTEEIPKELGELLAEIHFLEGLCYKQLDTH